MEMIWLLTIFIVVILVLEVEQNQIILTIKIASNNFQKKKLSMEIKNKEKVYFY